MRRRRKTDESTETLIVSLDDGKKFRASIAATGRETEPRWVLMDEQAEQYVGPPVLADHSPEAVQHQIAEWWEGRQSPGTTKSGENGRPGEHVAVGEPQPTHDSGKVG